MLFASVSEIFSGRAALKSHRFPARYFLPDATYDRGIQLVDDQAHSADGVSLRQSDHLSRIPQRSDISIGTVRLPKEGGGVVARSSRNARTNFGP
jgi:hypothetical protein